MNLKTSFFASVIAFATATTLIAGSFSQVHAKATANTKKNVADEDIRIVKVDDSNFEKEILHSKAPIILEISSTSCPPCLVMIPTLIGIAKNYRDIKVASVGIDEPNIDKIRNTLPIQAFPTFFLIKDGQIINRLVGVVKEEQLLQALNYTPSAQAASASKSQAKKPSKKTGDRNLVCKVNGQFHGLKNLVTISFVFGDTEIKNVDIVTDVFVPPEMSDKREEMMAHIRASGKGEVTPTMAGFQMHIDNDCRFMKAMDMKRTSTYGEMRAGLELQGFKCE
jgi:thiol-disulfide isomerase/thioredoxin